MGCNTPERIVMKRRLPLTETRIVSRILLSAGVLAALLLACAGTVAGATWVVDGDGGADRMGMQVAEAAAGVAAGATWDIRALALRFRMRPAPQGI